MLIYMSFGEHTSKQIIGTKGDSLKGKKIVLCVTGSVARARFLETKAAIERRGALREEADLVFVNQSMISFLVITVSFMVPIVKAQVHELLRTQVYRYILLGAVSSIIVSASLLIYYREHVTGKT